MTHLVGLVGSKGAGKTTAAQMLAQDNGFSVIKMADPLKNMLRTLFASAGYDPQSIEEFIEGQHKEEPIEVLGMRTPRHAMQTLGTEWGRDMISPTIWTDIFKAAASQKRLVVCDDVRFMNEAVAIREMGGRLIRIVGSHEFGVHEVDSHQSEQELNSIPVDFAYVNDGTILSMHQALAHFAFAPVEGDPSIFTFRLDEDGEKVVGWEASK